jgi:hypothetical protein
MPQVKQEVLDAFALMWGDYPAPVMLIHSSREIVATNAMAQELGVPSGIKCHSLYPSDTPCPGCMANKALRQKKPVRKTAFSPATKSFMDGFWLPVPGDDEVYVHFGNDITEFVRPELMPET